MKKVIILGVSGTIGHNALIVARNCKTEIEIVGLHAHTNYDFLLSLKDEFPLAKLALSNNVNSSINNIDFMGDDALKNLILTTKADVVLNGIASSAGLLSSVYTLQSGKDLALANKESMVMAATLLLKLAKDNNCKILPVDSEHSALFYLLENRDLSTVKELILTASGGPFKYLPSKELENVTPDDAANHPTWKMGRKISIDSASLANKGLEVIEAYKLFGLPLDKIKVVIHPQSIVHSLIKTTDGVLYAHMSKPSMTLPIQNALLYPILKDNLLVDLDLTDLTLTFKKPRYDDFKLLDLAYLACKKGDAYTIVYNAANEVAVEAFCQGKIKFTELAKVVEHCLNACYNNKVNSIEEILAIDKIARERANEII